MLLAMTKGETKEKLTDKEKGSAEENTPLEE
jgi:hypothetical protein